MQHVARSPPALAQPQALRRPHRAGTAGQVRVTTSRRGDGGGAGARRVAPALRVASRVGARGGGGGTTEPPVGTRQEAAEVVAEKLEVLEEAAIAGEDEGRRPTDYDRRAHIFEESSRVFQELKKRRDGDGKDGREGVEDRAGATHDGAISSSG